MKPNYLIIGAAKAATTSLSYTLGTHPDVFMVECKEPNFFCNDDVYARGWNWYESLYAKGEGRKALGEASNRYTEMERFPHTIERITKHVPDSKLIYLTRHPLDRMESLWIQKFAQGDQIPRNFTHALRELREMFVDSSNYWRQINAYRQFFPDDRILLLFYEDYKADSHSVLQRCFKFLGVDPNALNNQAVKPVNVSKGKPIDTRAMSMLRKIPGYRMLKDLLPKDSRSMFKRKFLQRRLNERPHWDGDTRRWVIDELGPDTRRFLEFAGKPAGYWDLESTTRRSDPLG
jgi:hypothetical protein